MTRALRATAFLAGAVAAGAMLTFAQELRSQQLRSQEPRSQEQGRQSQSGVPPASVPPVPTVSSSQVIGAQGADEWLASQLRGTVVVGADGQRIGEVVDVLLDRNGQARAFVVGMGGVMGLGAKEVAIDLGQFHEMPAPTGTGPRAELKVPMTMEQLAAVPEFKPLPVPDATTGAAPR
jgi:hypothetical protein